MIVKWPGVTHPSAVTAEPVIIEDFFPTILEMAGIKSFRAVQPIDGESFCRVLKTRNTDYKSVSASSRAFIWHFPNWWGPTGPGIGASSTIRLGDYKLIYYHADQNFELFNIAADIGEVHNLIGEKPDIALKLAGILGDKLRSENAQMPEIRESGLMVPWPDEAAKKQFTKR